MRKVKAADRRARKRPPPRQPRKHGVKMVDELRLDRDRLRLVLEAGRLGMWDWNLVTGDILCCPRAARMFGLAEDTTETTFEELLTRLHPDDRPLFRRIHQALPSRPGNAFCVEYRVLGADGKVRWISSRGEVFLDADKSPVRLVSALTDITPIKRAEQIERGLKEELERRVARRTAELQEAVRQLESFSYSVSHDIRAPLRAIQNYAKLIRDEIGEKVDEKTAAYLGRIGSSAARLHKFTLELLAYSRVSSVEVRLEPVDVGAIAQGLLLDYPVLAEARAAIELVEPLGRALANEQLLRQALANLLENAVKFGEPTRPLRVRISSAPRGERLAIRVEDNGIGIEERHLARVFQPFERLRPRESEGAGIGLAIAKKAVERMGGSIELSSRPGIGSVFLLELRRA